jgi:hypothetical protein
MRLGEIVGPTRAKQNPKNDVPVVTPSGYLAEIEDVHGTPKRDSLERLSYRDVGPGASSEAIAIGQPMPERWHYSG